MSDMQQVIGEMTAKASAFLDSLDSEQRAKTNLPIEDSEQRQRWYYTPNERPGIPLIELGPRQQLQAFRLLTSGLSEPAYNAVTTIMGIENLLGRREGWTDARFVGREEESRFRDPSMYYWSVWGEPGGSKPWGWQVGGHHVSVHFTIKDGFVQTTPFFFGSNPARAPLPGGYELRPLAAEEDLARELVMLLRPGQREQALISPTAPEDIVQSNRPRIEIGALPLQGGMMMGRRADPGAEGANRGPEGAVREFLKITPEIDEMVRYTEQPKGLSASELDGDQKALLGRILNLYFDRVPEAIAQHHKSAVDPQTTTFAWAGHLEVGGYHYYRIQSDRLLIEYDNTQNGANHIHSVWRDPVADFGGDVLREHYAAAH